MSSQTYRQIYAIVRQIPKGKVATYGQVATLTGCTGPRQVGYALHSLEPGSKVPWQRVINSKGEISRRSSDDGDDHQRILLEGEGVEFDVKDRINLKKYRWVPNS